MKHRLFIYAFGLLAFPALGEEAKPEEVKAQHQQGAVKLAGEQDELAADVQQLVIEQTVPEVIKLLSEVEEIMGDATDKLAAKDTGGQTIAAQTEIIEKIHAAAKERQKQSGGGPSGGAMMDMLERMMGENKESKPGGKPGEQPGKGQTGDSNTGNTAQNGESTGKVEERRVPKATGSAGAALPEEFRKALDAYNRGAEEKPK